MLIHAEKEISMNAQHTELERIDLARAIHVAALNDGDANAWAACFDTDAVQMPPNQPPNVGTERIQEWTRGFHAEFSIVAHDVELAGPDRAFERGSYEISLTPRAGGDPLRDSGKYLTIYRRAPGHEWLMAHDIWNSDNQPPNPLAG
jgi:ketosteroid isomerase-like protein